MNEDIDWPDVPRPAAHEHSWKFDGDDPYIVCHFCGEMRDAKTGRTVREAAQ